MKSEPAPALPGVGGPVPGSVWGNIRSRLPLLLLLIGMSTVFLFGNDRGYLHRDTWEKLHNTQQASSHFLSIAVNFSPDHHFLGFMSRGFDVDGNVDYFAYNRFPPSVYALIKLVTLPFGDDLLSRVYAAQLLMLGFFAGAAVLAYLSLCRLTGNRWIASASTLIVFSSTQLLRFSDTIDTQMIPDFFGCILSFHGMVVFAQEGRFRQLVIKSCLAVLIGWHVLALLLTFIFLGSIKEVVKISKAKTVHEIFRVVIASRYLKLGVITLGISMLILGYNIGNEYYALNIRGVSQLAISDLPSIRSILRRTSIEQEFGIRLEWIPFLESQFRRIGVLSVPFALPGPTISVIDSSLSNLDVSWIRSMTERQELYLGIAVVSMCAIGLVFVRHKLLTMSAIFAGFCWAIPMYGTSAEHAWEALYYVGIPLFFFVIILSFISKISSKYLMPFASIVALYIFVLSSYSIGNIDYKYDYPIDLQNAILDDYMAIRSFTEGKNIFVPIADTIAEAEPLGGGARFGLHYYLSGRGIVFNNYGCNRGLGKIDFMIHTRRDAVSGLLTPNNQIVFLYDRYVYEKRVDKIVERNRPVIRTDFDVYLTDDRKLVYISDRCDGTDTKSLFLGAPIVLNVYPVDIEDLADPDQGYEFSSFNFVEHFIMDTKRHVVIVDLPDYDIASIGTGQYTDKDRIWAGRFFGPDYSPDVDLIRRADQVTDSSKPIIRDRFDVYLADETSLMFVREPCYNSDISDDFFVHIFPVDTENLPEPRKQSGFDNFGFVFVDRGTRDGLKCVAVIKLPDYDIASIHIGQYTGQGQTWRSEFAATKIF